MFVGVYKVIGIDLAAKERNPTGICILKEKVITKIVYKDEEILKTIEQEKPLVVVFDAPLSIEIPFRECERELIKRGFHPLPLSLKSMQELAIRAQKLKEKIEYVSIETFPRAVEKILNFSYEKFRKYFRTKHEYDAWLCAIVGKCYLLEKYEDLEGIILPSL